MGLAAGQLQLRATAAPPHEGNRQRRGPGVQRRGHLEAEQRPREATSCFEPERSGAWRDGTGLGGGHVRGG